METKLKPPMHHLKKYIDVKNLAVGLKSHACGVWT
jgi:hypothetical protein